VNPATFAPAKLSIYYVTRKKNPRENHPSRRKTKELKEKEKKGAAKNPFSNSATTVHHENNQLNRSNK
jgi:hypothetical protein